MITIIVAIAENNGIGYKNQLLCHLPGDLKRFRSITMGHNLIMGKKTWESLPNKPLKGRKNIVLTDMAGDSFEGAFSALSMENALEQCDQDKETFIIGGGSVYRQFMPLADKLLITHLHKAFEADTFFPVIDSTLWEVISNEDHLTDDADPISFSYTTYIRKRG